MLFTDAKMQRSSCHFVDNFSARVLTIDNRIRDGTLVDLY